MYCKFSIIFLRKRRIIFNLNKMIKNATKNSSKHFNQFKSKHMYSINLSFENIQNGKKSSIFLKSNNSLSSLSS